MKPRARPKPSSVGLDGDGDRDEDELNDNNKVRRNGGVSGNGRYGQTKTSGLVDDVVSQSSSFAPSEDNSERPILEALESNPQLQNQEAGVKNSTSSKKRKRSPNPNTWSSDDEDKDHKPSYLRLTTRGGYKHTNKSKLRISRANKGNTPWNKGKNRSESVKAKIKAGVQARNRALLLEKLKVLGMTEEEWDTKKKEIKYLRERVRRAKVANNKFKAAFEEQRLKEALKNTKVSKDEEKKIKASVVEQRQQEAPAKPRVKGLEMQEVEQAPKLPIGFSREISFQPVEIDDTETSAAYGWKCPNGGPGGLICCESCSAAYSKFLTQTTREIETQRASNIGYEIKELLGFLAEAQAKLSVASEAAKTKAPPTTPRVLLTSGAPRKGRKAIASSNCYEDFDWDVTNAMDIVAEPNVAKR